MNVPTRLAAFAVVLALAFGGAALAGAAIDPTDGEAPWLPATIQAASRRASARGRPVVAMVLIRRRPTPRAASMPQRARH